MKPNPGKGLGRSRAILREIAPKIRMTSNES